jgi:molecular chaperone IbpA
VGLGPKAVLTQQGNTLIVAGRKEREQTPPEMLHQGLAFRDFRQTFNLADHVKVTGATLENGLLSVDLEREIPEQLKPRRIEVTASQRTISSQDSHPQPAERPGERQVKVA